MATTGSKQITFATGTDTPDRTESIEAIGDLTRQRSIGRSKEPSCRARVIHLEARACPGSVEHFTKSRWPKPVEHLEDRGRLAPIKPLEVATGSRCFEISSCQGFTKPTEGAGIFKLIESSGFFTVSSLSKSLEGCEVLQNRKQGEQDGVIFGRVFWKCGRLGR